jgi:hypothetical protein
MVSAYSDSVVDRKNPVPTGVRLWTSDVVITSHNTDVPPALYRLNVAHDTNGWLLIMKQESAAPLTLRIPITVTKLASSREDVEVAGYPDPLGETFVGAYPIGKACVLDVKWQNKETVIKFAPPGHQDPE